MRDQAEVSAAKAAEALSIIQDALGKISVHRHSWFSLTENSRISELKQRSLKILDDVQKRLAELENDFIMTPLEWQEIPYSDNRASMPVDNIHNMTDELEEIIANLKSDEQKLAPYRAQKLRKSTI